MKKVIFIGGTSYSGSTFLDMILSNDPKGFSCGEVDALFNPYRPQHINPGCGCGNKNCNIWQRVLKNGENNLYETLFDRFSELDFIVDSSKDQFWIHKQIKNLNKKNIIIKNILIWKTPLESAHSFKKRDRLRFWERSWINYYRPYFSLVDNWKAIKYYDLTSNKGVLLEVCKYVGIPYFAEKYKFWLKTNHTLFGNTSAKIHLYKKDSKDFHQSKERLIVTSNKDELNFQKKYRKIYYNKIDDKALMNFVEQKMKSNWKIEKILEILTDLESPNGLESKKNIDKLKIPTYFLQIRKIQEMIFFKIMKLFLSCKVIREKVQ